MRLAIEQRVTVQVFVDVQLTFVLQEREALLDSATTVGGADRKPSGKEFFSIGHIALDMDPGFTKKFDLPLPDSAIWIKSLYISTYVLSSLSYEIAVLTIEQPPPVHRSRSCRYDRGRTPRYHAAGQRHDTCARHDQERNAAKRGDVIRSL